MLVGHRVCVNMRLYIVSGQIARDMTNRTISNTPIIISIGLQKNKEKCLVI